MTNAVACAGQQVRPEKCLEVKGGATDQNRKLRDATAASVRKVSLMATEEDLRTSVELFLHFL